MHTLRKLNFKEGNFFYKLLIPVLGAWAPPSEAPTQRQDPPWTGCSSLAEPPTLTLPRTVQTRQFTSRAHARDVGGTHEEPTWNPHTRGNIVQTLHSCSSPELMVFSSSTSHINVVPAMPLRSAAALWNQRTSPPHRGRVGRGRPLACYRTPGIPSKCVQVSDLDLAVYCPTTYILFYVHRKHFFSYQIYQQPVHILYSTLPLEQATFQDLSSNMWLQLGLQSNNETHSKILSCFILHQNQSCQ